MRRFAMVGALAAAAVLVSGCGLFGRSYDIHREVAGAGTADKVDYSLPGDKGACSLTAATLPWTKDATTGFGFIHLDVTASTGPTVRRRRQWASAWSPAAA